MAIEAFNVIVNMPQAKVKINHSWEVIPTIKGKAEILIFGEGGGLNKPWFVFSTVEDLAAFLVTYKDKCQDRRLFLYTYQDVERLYFAFARNKTLRTTAGVTKISAHDMAGNKVTVKFIRDVDTVGFDADYSREYRQTLEGLNNLNLRTSYLTC